VVRRKWVGCVRMCVCVMGDGEGRTGMAVQALRGVGVKVFLAWIGRARMFGTLRRDLGWDQYTKPANACDRCFQLPSGRCEGT
jgi:hypothetical protein